MYIIFCVTLISGCKKNKFETDINSTVLVELQDAESNEAQLKITTTERYPCANYSIDYSQRKIGSTITISLNHAIEPDICFTAFGPAQSTILLDNLTKNKYEIKLKLNRKTTKGTLTMNPYKLELDQSDEIRLK